MGSELHQLADRHFRQDPQGVIAGLDQLKPGTVLVQVSEAMATAVGAQHLIWMLVNLLSRQFKVVHHIILDVPSVSLHQQVAPFGLKPTLVETLEECVSLVSGPHVSVSRYQPGDQVDIALTLGDCAAPAPWHWRVYADGWRFFVGLDGDVPDTPPNSDSSIGPYLCASHAAGEVFKLLRGMKPGKGEFINMHFASAWSMSTGECWSDLVDGPDSAQFGELPHFYFAGAGAVAQAAALCLGTSDFRGTCTTVDKDTLDLTNDNRYTLSTRDDDGASKVELMKRYLDLGSIRCKVVPAWWEEFASSGGRNAFDEQALTLERAYKFPVVLSCVDENEPRHALQNLVPQVLFGGSTDGLSAKASIFDLGANTACLKCHNPLKSRNAVIEERSKALRALEGAQRRARAAEWGLSEKDVELLLGPSGCGKLSEADLDRFAAASPQMSVGFVSVAAGVLLAAQLLRYLKLGGGAIHADGPMAVATFSRARLRLMRVARDESCECLPKLRDRWSGRWPGSYRA